MIFHHVCIYTKICIYTHKHTHHIFCILSSINRPLNCFPVLVIVNNTVMNVGVYFFEILISFPLDIYLEMELLDHMVVILLIF